MVKLYPLFGCCRCGELSFDSCQPDMGTNFPHTHCFHTVSFEKQQKIPKTALDHKDEISLEFRKMHQAQKNFELT